VAAQTQRHGLNKVLTVKSPHCKENIQENPTMNRFFNSPWPLIVVMSLGTAVALATSISFISENEVNSQINEVPPLQLSNQEHQP